jgi:hypothetical protein
LLHRRASTGAAPRQVAAQHENPRHASNQLKKNMIFQMPPASGEQLSLVRNARPSSAISVF